MHPTPLPVEVRYGVHPKEYDNAWRGLGRLRQQFEPFGDPVPTNFARIGRLNARSLRQVGLEHLALAAEATGKAMEERRLQEIEQQHRRATTTPKTATGSDASAKVEL